jgi:SAM-dependent methyltransferase
MKLTGIDQGRPFDWGKTSDDYAKYRDIYPDVFYQKIIRLGLCVKGQRVLDLGTGTGVLPRNLHKHGASFTGVDISENQIAQARRLSLEAGMDIEYIVTPAEKIHFPANSFDVVMAAQCLMYFDKAAVVPKVHGVLKSGGRFCILFMSWLPGESGIASGSEQLVLKHNPAWMSAGMKRHALETPEWSKKWFDVEHAETYDVPVVFTRETWHGRMKACRGIGASSLSPDEIAAFEKEHLAFLERQPERFEIPHFATLLNLRKKELP